LAQPAEEPPRIEMLMLLEALIEIDTDRLCDWL
jgi:hypothetical protein